MPPRLVKRLVIVSLAALLLVVAWLVGCGPSADLRRYDDVFARPGHGPFVVQPSQADSTTEDSTLTVTYFGTSTLLFDDGVSQVLIDGYLSRPGLWSTLLKPIQSDTALVDRLLLQAGANRLSALFVVHTHHDHVLDAPYIARRQQVPLYGSPSTLAVGRGDGVADSLLISIVPGRTHHVGHFRVTALPSRHGPQPWYVRRLLDGRIDEPLEQPAHFSEYKEGESYDLHIRHGSRSVLVKASAGFIPGALDSLRAGVLFLGIGRLGKQSSDFRTEYYVETVRRVRPQLIVPIHWDSFFRPLDDGLEAASRPLDDIRTALDELLTRASQDSISVRLLRGKQQVTLFH